MDYKEKLRLAKEALESGSYDKDTIEYIFPELAESEDEKIRKEIISHLKYLGKYCQESMPNVNEWIAWLEKQGDKKSFDDLTQQEAMDIAVAKCFEQDEQNPTDKVEPKIKVKYAGCEYNVLEVKDIVGVTYYGIEDEPNHIDYVKADNCKIISGGYGIKENGSPYPTKTAVFSEQKPAWSEEDMKEALRTEYEKGRADTIAEIGGNFIEDDSEEFDIAIETLKEAGQFSSAKWLESIKDRVLPKQKWNKYDKKVWESIIKHFEHELTMFDDDESKDSIDEQINWLKQLKQRIGG